MWFDNTTLADLSVGNQITFRYGRNTPWSIRIEQTQAQKAYFYILLPSRKVDSFHEWLWKKKKILSRVKFYTHQAIKQLGSNIKKEKRNIKYVLWLGEVYLKSKIDQSTASHKLKKKTIYMALYCCHNFLFRFLSF